MCRLVDDFNLGIEIDSEAEETGKCADERADEHLEDVRREIA